MYPPRRRRSAKHRYRRDRRPREGMLLLADGSKHRWLEDRGPQFTLLAAIDDATSKPWGLFRESEDAEGYFTLLRCITRDFGVPHAWYTDRDSVFVNSHFTHRYRDPILNPLPPTQFARALGELGIELILARSPQGKGRIERFFDTAQDRLVSYLRMHDVRTMAHASRILPTYLASHSSTFGVVPRDTHPAWLPWPEHLSPNDVFCLKSSRKLGRDHTISVHGRQVAVPRGHVALPRGAEITLLEGFDGNIRMAHRGQPLGHIPPPEEPPRRPSPSHPWRRPR